MKSRKELIETALSLETGRDYCQLYEFASKYLSGIKHKGETENFFGTIKILMNNSNIKQNSIAVGFSGNSGSETIKKWCGYILSRNELMELCFDDLHYVMGYCARLSKIKQEGC
ncbi:MAG: hypothetical protein J5997_02435 [Oscillospiraceae bacterium]|nr:hypothetical protein [Oscillospiraceae bacterium]